MPISVLMAVRTTKEMAKLLNVSGRTIESHRQNIRMKVGLHGKKSNLTCHLFANECRNTDILSVFCQQKNVLPYKEITGFMHGQSGQEALKQREAALEVQTSELGK